MSEATNTETEHQTSSWREKTLKAAGYGYLLGDAAFAASGLLKGGKAVFRTGAIWAAGGIGAAVYGNPDADKQLEILAHKLEAHLVQHGAKITDLERNNSELLRGKNGLGAKLDRFLHSHPTELLNAAYAVGAMTLLHSGLKDLKKINTNTTAMGALVLAGALGGLLIKEDPDARAKVDQNSIVSRVAGYIKEKPLRFSGTLYALNNIFTFKHALHDRDKFAHVNVMGMKPYYFSMLTAASYVAANCLLFASSRDQIDEKKFKPEHIMQLEQVAAEIIAAQPPQLQAQLLRDVSEYLAKEKMIAVTAPELAHQLVERVSEVAQRNLRHGAENNWSGRIAAKNATNLNANLAGI